MALSGLLETGWCAQKYLELFIDIAPPVRPYNVDYTIIKKGCETQVNIKVGRQSGLKTMQKSHNYFMHTTPEAHYSCEQLSS